MTVTTHKQQENVRVRFAPSPTGYLHIGSLRTALYNALFAKKYGGTFILRIEDTDQKRLVADATEKLLQTLIRFFPWDEGLKIYSEKGEFHTETIGKYGPYVQSNRLEIYKEHVEELMSKGKAYRCFCTAERLIEMRTEQESRKLPTGYDGRCRDLSTEDVALRMKNGESFVVRLRVAHDGKNIVFKDLVRGNVSFSKNTLDDQVLLKSDGFPTYHLANVVDDHLMCISHVIRGEEWLSSTPKHVLLYEAFGWDIPTFAHLPLLLNADRSKLSKRQGDVAVEDYLAQGYLPEALINFVALLGWNPGEGKTQEIFSLDELVEAFDCAHIHKGGAVFDTKKLDWLNAQYIKSLSTDDLLAKSLPFLEQKPWFISASFEMKTPEYLRKVLMVERDRLVKFADVGDAIATFFFAEPKIEASLLPWKRNSSQETHDSLERAHAVLSELSGDERNWTKEYLEKVLFAVAGEKRGDFLWPLRVALSGAQKSPSPFEIAWVIGKDRTLDRIERAKNMV